MNIIVEFDQDRSSVYKCMKFYGGKVHSRFLRLVVPTVCLFIGLAGLALTSEKLLYLALVLGAAIGYVGPSADAWLSTRRHFYSPSLGGSVRFELTEERLSSQSDVSKSVAEWRLFTKWMESPEAFLLIIRKGRFLMILKCGFQDRDQIGEFREFLTSRMGKAA